MTIRLIILYSCDCQSKYTHSLFSLVGGKDRLRFSFLVLIFDGDCLIESHLLSGMLKSIQVKGGWFYLNHYCRVSQMSHSCSGRRFLVTEGQKVTVEGYFWTGKWTAEAIIVLFVQLISSLQKFGKLPARRAYVWKLGKLGRMIIISGECP